MHVTTLLRTPGASRAGQPQSFARLLLERLAELESRPVRGAAGHPQDAVAAIHHEPYVADWADDRAREEFYSRALMAIEAEASRLSSRPEISVDVAFLAASCMVGAPDLGRAIDRASRFYAALHRAAGCSGRNTLDLHVCGRDAEMRIYTAGPGPHEPATFMSALLGAVFHIRLFGWLIGEEIRITSAATSYRALLPQPALQELLPWAIEYSADLGPACDFRVVFPSRYLTRPVVRTGGDVEKLEPLKLLFNVSPQSSVTLAVRRIFLGAISRGVSLPSAARVSALCHRSPATVRRHLARERTSVREIREQCVRERAFQLLPDRSIRLAELASRLGFSDAPCFRRAFRRWTGISPGTYRRRLASNRAG